ncbi:glycosyl transferase family 4 [filamentous cyanobacterium LEGE 11480]|uniref:Glycosyl transferase family 4 n=1 Tax=Romeriopsis navalis LEGE 11480 TaxID=2777977 RepID=A0A928VJI7_9CYAN|nr:glycosyl transferase family 4 [Romeriopsis navalis]MBE9028898.1 glycosyl transferase family 4 [Romeriopsis navalis LEGE 11480]
MSLVMFLSVFAFCLSAFCVSLVKRYLKNHLVDIPNARSSHKQPTPRGGGLGFIVAGAVSLFLYQVFVPNTALAVPPQVWVALLPLIVISIIDDWKTVKARTRYAVQIAVAAFIVFQTGPFPQPWFEDLGLPGNVVAFGLTIIGLTALINFYNFMDGLDGLVAGVALVQMLFCAVALNQPEFWVLAMALLGFLVWNWSPAKIFMGDAGSTIIGAVIAASILYHSNHAASQPVGLAWSNLAIVLPLVTDAIYTLFRRSLRGENIFQAHRSHLYQRLNQTGWSHAEVATFYIGSAVLIACTLMLLGPIGAVLSLVVTIGAIFQIERYIQLHQPPVAVNAQVARSTSPRLLPRKSNN